MTTTLQLDPTTGDLAVSRGRAVLTTTDAEQVAQRITTALRFHRGENRYNLDDGFPWLDQVLSRKLPPASLEARLRAYVLAIPGVTSVDSVRVTLNTSTRKASITVTVNGSTTVEVGQ